MLEIWLTIIKPHKAFIITCVGLKRIKCRDNPNEIKILINQNFIYS